MSKPSRSLQWAALLLVCAATQREVCAEPQVVSGQAFSPTLGSRLRVHSLGRAGTIDGEMTAVDRETVTVGGRLVVRSDISRVELQVRPGRKRKWALRGAGIGILTAIALIAIDDASHDRPFEPDLVWGTILLGPPALIGAGIGAAAAPGAQWTDVSPRQLPTDSTAPPSDQRLTLGLSKGRGLAAAVTWSW